MLAAYARKRATGRFLSLLVLLVIAGASRGATISFTNTTVKVTGATANGKVVLVGVALEPRAYHNRLNIFRDVLEDTDGDGIITKDLDNSVFWKAIWGVEDLQTRSYATGHPDRSPGRERPRELTFAPLANGPITTIAESGELLEFVLVRPSGDVYIAQVVDGGSDDRDGESNGQITASIDSFVLVAGTGTPPDRFNTDDVVFVFDADLLTITPVKVQ